MLRPIKRRLRLTIPALLLACSAAANAGMPAITLSMGDVSCRVGQPEPGPSQIARWETALGQRMARAIGAAQLAHALRHHRERATVMMADLNTYLKGES